MKLTLSPFSICRTPIFPIHEELSNVWEELKTYIHESSPAFFEIIKDYQHSDLLTLEPKTRFTIWKYFNRARFRGTPYGNFAAFSIIPVNRENQPAHIFLSEKTLVHRFANWQEKENISFDPKWLSNHAISLRTNTTGYLSNQELRFVNIENGSFELSSITVEKTTLATLDFCRHQRTLTELRQFLQNDHGLSRSLTRFFIEQLISIQLLLTNFHPNIIGNDYFSRIAHSIEEKKNDYLIAERKTHSGQLSEKNLQVLTELTNFLCKHQEAITNASLTDFRKKFVSRFENQEVPLMIAMDPEMGIGYRSLAQDKEEDQLIQDLKTYKEQTKKPARSLSYSPLHQFILNGMVAKKTVQLHDFTDADANMNVPVANTISIMLHYADQHLIVEQFGGCTANSLLGRFSLASDEITAIGHQLARLEQEANPDILFFDIGYQIEKNADNINRRKSIYDYELPILSWTESKHVLDLNDILLSVKGSELILYSVKYKKRIVPKLASAYNYSRSDLAVYRFLSDLQHQGIHSSLGINVLDIFPGLLHYQRIQYKNIILSAEKWLVPKHICNGTHTDQLLAALQEWLNNIGLQRSFRAGISDQTLTFNPAIKEDMLSFLLFCKNKTDLYIEEAFIPDVPLVNDESGRSYQSEFIVHLEHKEQLYEPYQFKGNNIPVKRTFLPGEEWLYFEIYCHPSSCNSLLLYIAANYLTPVKKKLKNWFFIRYNDPSYHIRLRLQLIDLSDLNEMVSGLSSLLESVIAAGIIADLQLKIYRREAERYGAARIELVEKCFGTNSDFILFLISKPGTIHFLYSISIIMIENICQTAGYSLEEQIRFAENMAGLFSAEMKVSSEGLKKINQGYKDFNRDHEIVHPNKLQLKKLANTTRAFLVVLTACLETERNSLLSDMFHMHTNRLFSNDQRMHEMIIYHYLTRRLKMKLGRLKQIIQ